MENARYIIFDIEGILYLVKYCGNVEPSEINDSFNAYMEDDKLEYIPHENAVREIMDGFGVEYEIIPSYRIVD